MAPQQRLLVGSMCALAATAQYSPTWDSLDTRPLPSWYDEAKIGIFISFGVFSVPSFGTPTGGASGEWFWWQLAGAKNPAYVNFVAETEAPSFSYPDYAARYDFYFFNATQWAELFAASGAKYIVPITKHHDGFANWNSSVNFNWNSVDVGPKRDITGELLVAAKAAGLHPGVYHSLFEWFNPSYLSDKASKWTTNEFRNKTFSELYDLVNRYEPELIWSDGDWEAPDAYWDAPDFLAWLANESPVKDTVVWNDRWGQGNTCHHGSYWTCSDRYLPSGKPAHKWENAFTIDKFSWGYRRNMVIGDVLPMEEIIVTVVKTVALGGNALINIGPAHDGTIDPIFQDRLLGLGSWLKVNGEAIYFTQPWREQNDTAATVWYTATGPSNATAPQAVYAIATAWPANNELVLSKAVPTSTTTATLLGTGTELVWKAVNGLGQPGIQVTLPNITVGALPCNYAWAIKLLGVQ